MSKKSIRAGISTFDGVEIGPEEFVRPLVQEIQKEIVAPPVDLSSAEAAEQSLIVLNETAEKLADY